MERFKKWFENYWYHYKGHTLIALFVAAVLIVGITQCSTKDEYDYLIMMGFKRFVPDTVTEAVSRYFEQYGEDLNGDGKVMVQIMDVSTYSGQADTLRKSASAKMQAESIRNEIMIYIVDEGFYDTMNNRIVVFDTCEYFPDKNGTAYNFKNSDLADCINEAYGDDYISASVYITKRKVPKDNAAYAENAKKADDLLKKVTANIAK